MPTTSPIKSLTGFYLFRHPIIPNKLVTAGAWYQSKRKLGPAGKDLNIWDFVPNEKVIAPTQKE